MIALDILRRQIACRSLPEEPAYEIRYPYLDRDFLEFAYSIPREQLIRPGQRRSLMRRALRGIVPDAVINRKRKAFVAREPRVAISSDWATCVELSNVMVTEAMGIVSASRFREALQTARVGGELQIIHLTRTLAVESWLRTFHARTDLRLQPAKAVQHTRHVGNGVEFIGP
jgi:asparagine synthase (glutamine-hydrolysing)